MRRPPRASPVHITCKQSPNVKRCRGKRHNCIAAAGATHRKSANMHPQRGALDLLLDPPPAAPFPAPPLWTSTSANSLTPTSAIRLPRTFHRHAYSSLSCLSTQLLCRHCLSTKSLILRLSIIAVVFVLTFSYICHFREFSRLLPLRHYGHSFAARGTFIKPLRTPQTVATHLRYTKTRIPNQA